jgi:putative transposase
MREVILTHRIALNPTKEQEVFLRRCVGVARFSYNWALAEWQHQHDAGQKPNEAAMRKLLNSVKRVDYPWMLDVPKAVAQQAIKNLGTAFKKFFRKEAGYPNFKKKGVHDSARLDNGPGTFQCDGKRIKLPVIGWMKLFESLRFQGRPLSATVSRVANRWYVAIPVAVEISDPIRENQASIGIDLGVKCAITCSDGAKYDAPKALKKNIRKLKRLSRQHSHKVKGSRNRKKSAMKLAILHARITNIRKDWLHKITTTLTRQYTLIGVETLNVQGMMSNHHIARAIADIGFFEFKRQLTYKADLYGTVIVSADMWFPSSKTCSVCGYKLTELSLSVREWSCPTCGCVHDRDVNAAQNLQRVALKSTGSLSESDACQLRRPGTDSGQEPENARCLICA